MSCYTFNYRHSIQKTLGYFHAYCTTNPILSFYIRSFRIMIYSKMKAPPRAEDGKPVFHAYKNVLKRTESLALLDRPCDNRDIWGLGSCVDVSAEKSAIEISTSRANI